MIILSKINKKLPLASFYRLSSLKNKRVNLCPENEFIQVSFEKLKENRILKSHYHINNIRKTNITQEGWVVFRGKIRVTLFDLDKSLVKNFILKRGDCFVLFRGGHSFRNLSKNTILFEIKNGPYKNSKKDYIEF